MDQKYFLYKLLTVKPMVNKQSTKKCRFDYSVIVNSTPIEICRKAFLSIFDIQGSRVDKLREKNQV